MSPSPSARTATAAPSPANTSIGPKSPGWCPCLQPVPCARFAEFRSRPSNARIAQLSQQNAALEAKLQEQQAVAGSERATRSTPSTNSSTAISNSTPSTGTSQDGSNRLPPTVPDEEAAEANGPDQQYHGPTSAMFDALTLEDGAKMVPLAMAEGHQRALLTAETLKQRRFSSISSAC